MLKDAKEVHEEGGKDRKTEEEKGEGGENIRWLSLVFFADKWRL